MKMFLSSQPQIFFSFSFFFPPALIIFLHEVEYSVLAVTWNKVGRCCYTITTWVSIKEVVLFFFFFCMCEGMDPSSHSPFAIFLLSGYVAKKGGDKIISLVVSSCFSRSNSSVSPKGGSKGDQITRFV